MPQAHAQLDLEPFNLARELNRDSMRANVHVLTSPALAGRKTGTPGGAKSAKMLESRLRAYGLTPGNN